MGLNVPDLDDRTFEQLVEAAMRSIPVHSDEWTDHNATDPGITILETLAWVAESDIYQLNRVTDAHLRKYLQLLGVHPRPPRPASARLALSPPAEAIGTTIPDGTQLDAETRSGDTVAFTTDSPVTLCGAEIEAVVSITQAGQVDNGTANRTPEMSFEAFGPDAGWGSRVYLGFDGDPFADAERLDLYVDYHDEGLPDPATPETGVGVFDGGGRLDGSDRSGSVVGSPVEFEPSVELSWEHCVDLKSWYDDESWESLSLSRDETNRLYQGGTISLERPTDWQGAAGTILDDEEPYVWLRCVVTRPGYEVPPQLTEIRTNVASVHHRTDHVDEPLRRTDGEAVTTAQPAQRFVFERSPVLDATIRVGGDRWTAVPDFAASGPDDRHFVLERSAGAIRFGDGVRGAVPEAGLPVVATRYVHGGGTDGNVSTSATWNIQDDLDGDATLADVDAEPLSRASGGEDEESLDAALARLKRDLGRPYRLVTREDCQYVAAHTPGLRFGRTTVRVNDEAGTDGCGAHGDLRVVVVPFSTRPRPEPSEGFLEAVRNHLSRHRLLTDRVTVEPPTYVGVGVETVVELDSGFAEGKRTEAVEAALDNFLHPLSGFDGDGWPFGRPVYPSELYETIGTVPGVDCVHDVAITARGEYDLEDGAVVIGDGSLVYPLTHVVRIGAAGDRCRRWS